MNVNRFNIYKKNRVKHISAVGREILCPASSLNNRDTDIHMYTYIYIIIAYLARVRRTVQIDASPSIEG